MKFRTILADPPWSYRNKNIGRTGTGGSQRQYKTITQQDICLLPVANVADANAALLLWCTWPQLVAGLEVLQAWGFEYKSGFPWVKIGQSGTRARKGLGFHTRSASEIILIGTRGSCCPPPDARLDGLILCKSGRHSAKPIVQYDFAEAYGGPFLEIFARPDGGLFPPRDGWTRIGNEITGRDIVDDLRILAETPSGNPISEAAL